MMLLDPVVIGNTTLRNRIAMPAMHLNYTPECTVTDQLVAFYEARARGGVGLIVAGGCRIDENSGNRGLIGLESDAYIPGLKRLTDAVHAHGASIAAQLYHAGRYAHSALLGRQAIAPSAVASRFTGEEPREMTADDIASTIENYALATRRALAAGFDGVEILSNTGYLINQFLSAVTNRRTDGYGGDLAGRMRFGLEVAEAVKSAAGREGMVIIRLGGNDFMPRGCTLNETLAFAAELQKKEVDAFSVTGGWHETRVPQLPMEVPRGCYAYLAREVKKTVNVPVIACNRINDPDLAERIIREKSADMAGMARGLIADPELPNKLVRGEKADIAACIGCNQGCFDHIFRLEPVGCMVNPRAGFEHVSPASSKTASPKRVVVVGGGPAGLSAAAEAAARGHRVELYEKSDTLGGQLNLAGALEERREFITLKNTLISKARRSGAVLHTGVEADRALLERLKPDAIILASGGSPATPRIPGIDGANVVQAWDVLAGRADVGENVVIIGGGAVGIETGVFIAKMGTLDPHALHFLFLHQAENEETLRRLCTQGTKKVKIIEMIPRLGKDIGMSTRWVEIQMLKLYGVQAVTGATVTAITENGVVVQTDGTEETIACDTVVTAVGTSPVNGLEQEAKSVCKEVYVTGDARSPRKAYEAIHEGFEAAAAIS